jgi:hypothetical protein
MNAETAKSLLSQHGTCRPQPAGDWTGDFPLPSELLAFYHDIGPEDISIDTGANPIFFPSLAKLADHQIGYRSNGLTGERIEDWNPEWIVVADEGADPYIFHRGRILFAYHGEGEWNFREKFPDLVSMTCSLATKTYEDEDEE